MRALITGADGFVGRWLRRHLEAAGDEVVAAGGPRSASEIRLDVTDIDAVKSLLQSAQPEVIYHLAGIAHGPTAAASPFEANRVSVGGTAILLTAVSTLANPPTVLVASSAEVYAPLQKAIALPETHPLDPPTIYGATKAGQEMVAKAIARTFGIPIVITRSFNQIGPEQREDFVAVAFALQLARVAAGLAEPTISVGNLEPRRDFIDVRDAVVAFRALMQTRQTGIFNVASGRAITVRQLLDQLIELSGVDVTVTVDPSRVRAVDTTYLSGDATRLKHATGWTPTRTLRETLTDIWADAVERAEHAGPTQ